MQAERFAEALTELKVAEDLFRAADARGHPFAIRLPNGISGLASTLALTGRCHQRLGNIPAALEYYETSFINSKFEKKRSFTAFAGMLNEGLLFCYEHVYHRFAPGTIEGVLAGEPSVDTGYRFPFSLTRPGMVLARLYELAPARYAAYREFYLRAQAQDRAIRRSEQRSDATDMNRMSLIIWGVLIIIWTIYGLAMLDTLSYTY